MPAWSFPAATRRLPPALEADHTPAACCITHGRCAESPSRWARDDDVKGSGPVALLNPLGATAPSFHRRRAAVRRSWDRSFFRAWVYAVGPAVRDPSWRRASACAYMRSIHLRHSSRSQREPEPYPRPRRCGDSSFTADSTSAAGWLQPLLQRLEPSRGTSSSVRASRAWNAASCCDAERRRSCGATDRLPPARRVGGE